jgi:proteasome lid subunit RPN8/RPN11
MNSWQEDFFAHAIEEYPRECCGVVIVFKGRERYIRCANLAEDKNDAFIMSPEDKSAAEDMGDIIAVCHSHPNQPPAPSQGDLVECEKAALYEWHIVNVQTNDEGQVVTGDTYSFKPTGYEAPLVGRQFFHGTLDCYALVRDYYKREHGIELPDFPREDQWWEKGQDLYRENFAKAGFYELPLNAAGNLDFNALRPGDAFLMTLRSEKENHAAVYIGDGMILHHAYHRLSSRDLYSGYWQDNTTTILRHKGINQ